MKVRFNPIALAALCLALLTTAATTNAAASPKKVTPGGSHQRAALEGCMNEWLFNGIWRVKVTGVDPIKSTPDAAGGFLSGWGVTVQFRNGTATDFMPVSTGIGHLTLVSPSGDTLDVGATTIGTLDAQKLAYHDFPPSSQYTHQLTFWYPPGTAATDIKKPVKFLLAFDANVRKNASSGPQFTTADPSMRVKLSCSK